MNISLAELPKLHAITEQLSLRQLKHQDASELFRLTDDNRNYLRQSLPWLDDCIKEKNSLDFIIESHQDVINNKALVYGIFYSSKIAGVINLHHLDWIEQSAKIGYWIGKDFQGQGLVTTACKELIRISFDKLKFRNLFINCNVDNIRSQAVAIRLGFQFDKIVFQAENLYGTVVDHYLYVLKNSRDREYA